MTLRTLGGLTTVEIARAFIVSEPTMAARLVRAKRKIRAAHIPYRVPPGHQLTERLEGVLHVLYLIFNEGYVSASGQSLERVDLQDEAIRLTRVVVELMPDEPEALGLLSLMLFHHSRRLARVDTAGDLVLLDDQDRSLWDRSEIDEAESFMHRAMRQRRPGPYQLQGAIASLHAEARTAGETDWRQIVALYRTLDRLWPSGVVRLNHAVAVTMAEGPEAGLLMLEGLDEELDRYHLFHATKADLLRRLGRSSEAAVSYGLALERCSNEIERRFLARRIGEMGPDDKAPREG